MMARATGLEPATSGVTGRRSNQLSYARSPKKRALVKRAVTRRSVYVTLDTASSTPAGPAPGRVWWAAKAGNALPGRIVRNVFLGHARDYIVEIKDGSQLRITAQPS